MRFTQRNINTVVLVFYNVACALYLASIALLPDHRTMPVPTPVLVALQGVVLITLILHLRGSYFAPRIALLLMAVLVAANIPEPYLTQHAALSIFFPPTAALLLTDVRWTVVTSAVTLLTLLSRAGWTGVYAQSDTIIIFAVLVFGTSLTRYVLERAMNEARRGAEHLAQRAHQLERTVAQLSETNARFSTVFQANPLPIMITEAVSEKIITVNTAFVRLTGIASNDTVGFTARGLGLLERDAMDEVRQQMAREGTVAGREVTVHTAQGPRSALLWMEQLMFDSLPSMLVILQDVTEARVASQKARVEEARYRLLAENAQDMIALIDLAGVIQYASPSHQAILGRGPAELVGASLFSLIAREDQDLCQQRWSTLRVIDRNDVTARFLRADGSTCWVEATLKAVAVPNLGLCVMLAGRDVSARKQIEQQMYHAQLVALGQHAGGFSLHRLSRQPDARGAGMARQILSVTQPQEFNPSDVQLAPVVEHMAAIVRKSSTPAVDLAVACAPDLWVVRGDVVQLEQVILNLLLNARDAIREQGTITMVLANVRVDVMQADMLDISAGAYVRVTVTDTGCGIAPEVLPHIFEPFFTTKEPGKGIGLGLSVCRSILQQHGGAIRCESASGMGSAFTLYLPAMEDIVILESDASEPGRDDALRGREAILIVDDDATLRGIAARHIERFGYKVVEAASGEEALRLLQASEQRVDLVVTDIAMSAMGGRTLASRIAAIQPATRILLMTGAEPDMLDDPPEHDPILRKPFTMRGLLGKMRRVLDAPIFEITDAESAERQ